MTDYTPITSGGFTPSETGNDEPGGFTLGLEFIVIGAAWLKAIRWYQPAGGVVKTDARTAALYSTADGVTGTKVVADVTASPVGSGWQQINLPAPYALATSTIYRAAVLFPTGGYPATANFFAPGGPVGDSDLIAGPVRVVTRTNAADSKQGSFLAGGTIGFPAQQFNGKNYWVDVLVSDVAPVASAWTWAVTARQG